MNKNLALLFLALFLFFSLSATQSFASEAPAGKVVVYNWSEYIPQSVLANFTKTTGIEVVYSTFESNEAMIAKVKLMKGKGYDVVVPSSYLIEILKQENLIQEIDLSKIPNLANIGEQWLNQDFDMANTYSVPYMWGYTGLAYNSKYVQPELLTKWADLLRPEFKGKLIMTDDLRDAYCMAFKSKGRDCQIREEEGIKEAFYFLQELKPSIRIFDVTATKQSLISEEVWIGPIWNGDFLVAQEENENLQFVLPEEGGIIWMDTFVITKGAENVENAHTFINYMLSPEVAAACVEEFRYSTPNIKAIPLLSEDDQKNPILVPSEEDVQRSEYPANNLGSALAIYQKYWEMLKTTR